MPDSLAETPTECEVEELEMSVSFRVERRGENLVKTNHKAIQVSEIRTVLP